MKISLTSLAEILTIVLLMSLNLYPILELTRMIRLYTIESPFPEWYALYGNILSGELTFMWATYFAAPTLLAIILWELRKQHRR